MNPSRPDPPLCSMNFSIDLLPRRTVSLRDHRVRQDEENAAAGELWKDGDLVFTTTIGTALDAANVRRSFRSICRTAGIGGHWAPRELRTSFVSLLSASGVPGGGDRTASGPLEHADDRGYLPEGTPPRLVKGAEVMDQIFG
jgi:hypothetical protein